MNVMNGWSGKIAFSVVVLIAAVVSAWLISNDTFAPRSNTLRLGTGTFSARIVDSQSERTKGLSGTKTLPADQALIFVFEDSGIWKIWMKDMKYSIDIVWLGESKKVVDIVEGASPESYPKEFVPRQKARYVIEFADGTVKEKGIAIGQRADFEEGRE